jgi:hypothetical protein
MSVILMLFSPIVQPDLIHLILYVSVLCIIRSSCQFLSETVQIYSFQSG